MNKKPEYMAIMERVEQLRADTGLNKTQFASAFSMKPQSYHNLVGPQGSKPNIDLILGVCRAFEVSPDWLLFGRGPMYREPEAHLPEPGSQRQAEIMAAANACSEAADRVFQLITGNAEDTLQAQVSSRPANGDPHAYQNPGVSHG